MNSFLLSERLPTTLVAQTLISVMLSSVVMSNQASAQNIAVQEVAKSEGNAVLTLRERIGSELSSIQYATQRHQANERIGYLWAILAVDYRKAGDFQASEAAYLKSLDLQRDVLSVRRNYATTLDNLGTLYTLYGKLNEAERYNRLGAEIREALGYRLDAARSEAHLAEIELAKHHFKQTERSAAKALEIMKEENDPEALDLIAVLNALAFSRCLTSHCAAGLEDARQSLDMAKRRFGDSSMAAAHALMAVGFASWKSGVLADAEPAMRSAIEIMQRQAEPGGRALLLALMQYRSYLQSQKRLCDVEAVEKELDVAKIQQLDICAACVNVRSLQHQRK